VKAKLLLDQRTFNCTLCGRSLNRDVNAAVNIERETTRLHAQQLADPDGSDVAGLRPETQNADRRTPKTSTATTDEAVFDDGRTRHPRTCVV
jgi:putative transposase